MMTFSETRDLLAQPEEYTHDQLIGLISGILDGDIIRFEYNGIAVASNDGGVTVRVISLNGGDILGEMMVKGKPIEGTLDWIKKKAALYGGGRK